MKIATITLVLQVFCIRTSTSFAFVAQKNARQQSLTALSKLYETRPVVDVTDYNPRQTGMALMLDDGTRKSHTMAENTQFVTGFFKGLANRNSYRSLITSLYFVYKSMEEAMDSTDEARVQILDYPELRRLESLKKDMDFFYGKNVSITQWMYMLKSKTLKLSLFLHIVPVAQSNPAEPSGQNIRGTCGRSCCYEAIPPVGTSVYAIPR